MRPINAEWVIAGVATLKECYEKSDIDPLALKHVWTAMEMVGRLLEEAPTIEVVPAQQGQWIDTREFCGDFMCSNCDALYGTNKFNYCPNCGAKMDGGADSD